MKQQQGMGPSGDCVCLGCGATKPHEPGVPCRDERCPKCGRALFKKKIKSRGEKLICLNTSCNFELGNTDRENS